MGRSVVMGDDLVDAARDLAEDLLAEALPRRWHHVQRVTRRAGEFSAGRRRPTPRLQLTEHPGQTFEPVKPRR
jgi:CO/xanthine dehydrogenase Mo-binding subunit